MATPFGQQQQRRHQLSERRIHFSVRPCSQHQAVVPGSFAVCRWMAGRADLPDFLAEIDTLTRKSLCPSNNMLAPCKIVKEFAAPFTILKCTIQDAEQLSCSGAKIFAKFKAVTVQFFDGSPAYDSALTQRFQCLLRSRSRHQFVSWHCHTV